MILHRGDVPTGHIAALEHLVRCRAKQTRDEIRVVQREGEPAAHAHSVGRPPGTERYRAISPGVPAAGRLTYACDVGQSSQVRRRIGRSGYIAPVATTFALLALYWWTLAPSIAELHDNVDSGELVAVANVLGVAHPPGAAIWLPLGRGAIEVFTFLEEPAKRTNLLSALSMAAACGLLASAVVRWQPGTPGWAAAAAGIIAGVAPIPWAQALVTEVLALQALLTALAIWLAPDAARGRRWPVFAFVLGLLAWNHPTGLALAVPLAAVCVVRGRPGKRAAARALLSFAVPGIYSVAYLWLRADAPIAWGDTGHIAGVWQHLSGQIYQGAIERSPSAVMYAVPETLRRTFAQLPVVAWLLVVPGSLVIARSRPALGGALAATCVILVIFVSAYRATGRQDYLTPLVFIAAMVSAYGAAEAWDWLRARLRTSSARAAAGAIVAGLVAVWVVFVGNQVSLRDDTTLCDAAVQLLQAQPPGATIQTQRDADTFSLWYAQVVLGERPDVTIHDIRGVAPILHGTNATSEAN
ncbi:MAG: DUF2723 domain-containing protein [Chloroflexi bacterium]|nr:DUF2723 domain-containing protein [Chloroflexota bacterium]